MPMCKMRSEVCFAQKQVATEVLSAAFAEVVLKTEQPFVQCITNVSAPKVVRFDVGFTFLSSALLFTIHSLVYLSL